MKTKKIGFFLVMSLLFMISIVYSSNRYSKAAEEYVPKDFKFVINGTERSSGTEYELTTEQSLVNITAKGGWPTGAKVTWESSERGVVDIQTNSDPAKSNFVRLLRKGPGFSTITATIEAGKDTFSISCQIKVALKFDTVKTGLVTAKTTNTQVLVLNSVDEKKRVYLKYADYKDPEDDTVTVSGSAISFDAVSFSIDNTSVAKVDEKTGWVTAVGSGSAIITVTSNTMSSKDRPMSENLMVVVRPTFTIDLNSGTEEDPGSVDNTNKVEPVLGVPSNFTIESNAKYAENLKWVVYVDGSTTPLKSNGTLLQYSVSDISGNVTFRNVKAGTYEIFAFAHQDFVKGTNVPYAYMKIIVPIHLDDQEILMTVGDTYNILKNSNIPNMNIFTVGYQNGTMVTAKVEAGVITAKRKGEVTIVLDYNGKIFDDSLFDSGVLKDRVELHVKVIDGIALSVTNATMFTSGTLLIQELLTDPSAEVTWSSSNEDVAKVDRGLVTAGTKPGTTIITAEQTIDGITKKATCEITVQQSVGKIVVKPEVVKLQVGEFATLNAEITPATLNGVNLTWKSSDEKVVRIGKPSPLTTTIEGVGGGNAVISAINQDNVVVGYSHINVRKAVTKITLSETKVTVPLNTSRLQLRATVDPQDASNKEIRWSSSDTAKATVDANGLVSLKQPGTVSIIATSIDNPSITAICNITIEIPVTSVALDETTKTMYVGQSARLSYVLLPTNASKNSVIWTSTNTSVATVDATGRVTAKAVGTTVIMLKTIDGSKSVYCTINVRQVASGVKFDVSELTLEAGQYHYINAQLIPANSTDNGLLWESSDTKVATVDDKGKVIAKEAGTAIIMARTESGGMSYCKLTVIQPVESLLMNFSEKTIYVGDDFELTVSITPTKATKPEVTWKSSNTKIATVSDKGVVKGLAGGTAVITSTTIDGGHTATCVVTVREKITNLRLNYESYRLGLGKSVILIATAANETATNQKITWVSSNEKVATVNKNGKVTGLKYGFATITAYAQDGSGAEAICEIEVVKPVTRISISHGYLSMLVGEGRELKATLEPITATYNKVNWVTSDDSVALVDEDGFVTALKAGTATITAQAADNSGKKATCYITVSERIPSTGITVMDKKLVMVSGEQKVVQVSLNPTASTDRYNWSSDNAAVAKVDKKTGNITAKATGTANVTVMTDSGKTATIEITVVGLSMTSLELEQYTNYVLYVEGATTPVKWDISNPEIAVVTNGRVSTRAKGTATITATVNGRKLTCKLTVTKIR